jgi:hypothetical protein
LLLPNREQARTTDLQTGREPRPDGSSLPLSCRTGWCDRQNEAGGCDCWCSRKGGLERFANRIPVEQRKVVDKTGSARECGFAATVSACNDSKSGKGHRAFVRDPWEFCWHARSARISCKRLRLRASWARASSAIFFATSTQFTAMGLGYSSADSSQAPIGLVLVCAARRQHRAHPFAKGAKGRGTRPGPREIIMTSRLTSHIM